MEDQIVEQIRDLFEKIMNLGNGSVSLDPTTFSPNIYTWVLQIAENAVKPVAYILLGLFLLLELYHGISRNNPSNDGLLQLVIRVSIKVIVLKLLVDKSDLILKAFMELVQMMIRGIGNLAGAGGLTPESEEALRAMIPSGFLEQLIISAEIAIISLLVNLIITIISIIVLGRLVEMYVMIAIAPLPLATLPSEEYGSAGRNFLKNFFAVCLQGVLIFIVMSLFGVLVGEQAAGDLAGNSLMGNLFNCCGYVFLMLLAVFMTGKWSKSICNAM